MPSLNRNQYGLPRRPSIEIRRRLRREAGFGCVICGFAIGDYEHIDPLWPDAREHDPDRMAFLCIGCHGRVTRRYWSKEKVWRAKDEPYCNSGKCHDAFDVGETGLTVEIGRNRIIGVHTIFLVDGVEILTIKPPEQDGLPYRLSGRFYDSDNKLLFEIIDNEWLGDSEAWDIECSGGRITIRTSQDDIALQILCLPGIGIAIEKVNMSYNGVRLFADDRFGLRIDGHDGGTVIIAGREILGDGVEGNIAFSSHVGGRPPNLGPSLAIGENGCLAIGGGPGCLSLGALPRPDFSSDKKATPWLTSIWGKILLAGPADTGRNRQMEAES